MEKTTENTKKRYKNLLRTAATGFAVLGFMGLATGCAKTATVNPATKTSTVKSQNKIIVNKKSNKTDNQSKPDKKLNNMGAGCL
ncbi:MAG: hypothetical protein M1382_02570 [Candidatus Marsarchaeota archaeon]|nr:hypothetical protein [Candidatus Marsarchaeota archaeon]